MQTVREMERLNFMLFRPEIFTGRNSLTNKNILELSSGSGVNVIKKGDRFIEYSEDVQWSTPSGH